MSTNPEKLITGAEQGVEAGESAREQIEKQRAKYERLGELGPEDGEKSAERARVEALETAISVEAGGAEKKRGGEPSPAARRGPISKKERDASYTRTMKKVQAELSGPSRTFSKVIHNKTIEKASDVAGATIARPNAIASGAIAAFLATLALYYVAKNVGYQLSGFETIGAFAVGWVIGLLFDYFRIMITGKRS